MNFYNNFDEYADLTRIWTTKLYQEYDGILYRYRVKLPKPLIRISQATTIWGQWDPLTRTISISERLILSYPWDKVVEILKHEMCHQMVHELDGCHDQHGPHFLRAAERLALAPWARSATGDIPDDVPPWEKGTLAPEEERLLRKVEKLLALATSTNEHEAALAMQRVRQLYAQHHIERLAQKRAPHMTYTVITRGKKRIEAAESMIFSILVRHFNVQAIFTTLYDAKVNEEHKAVELLGTQEHVQIGEYVYHFLWNTIQALWRSHTKSAKGSGRRTKRAYQLGVLSGFRDKLAKETVTPEGPSHHSADECRALLILGEKELQAFVQQRYPRLGSRSWSSSHSDRSAFEAGRHQGSQLTLKRGLTREDGNRGHLLSQ